MTGWQTGQALESLSSVDEALAHYAEALTHDPLNAPLQRHYWGLQRQARTAASAVPLTRH